MMILITLVILCAFAIPVCNAKANQFLSRSLGSNMVFQRDEPFKVHGFASRPLARVSAKFNGNTYHTIASSAMATDGGYFWSIELPPMHGGFTAYNFEIASSTGESSYLTNVLFGDVFLCSGQSNMQLALPGIMDAAEEIADADKFPFIRVMNVGQNTNLPQVTAPLDDLYSTERPGNTNSSWVVGSSTAVADEALDQWFYYSAVCWLFGKNLFVNTLQSKVPVGLVSSCWGGTIVQSWSPPEVMKQCGDDMLRRQALSHARVLVDPIFPFDRNDILTSVDPNADSILYNTMIAPLKNMNFKGVVWYQGESNCQYGGEIYSCLQDGMVGAWRKLFGRGDIPFIYTQLSTWNNGGGNGPNSLPQFRLWQTKILNMTSKSAMVTAADLGDPDSPNGDIHPRYKSEVGRRLAMAASSLVYNTTTQHMGPVVLQAFSSSTNPMGLSARISFSPESCGPSGLYLKAAQVCPDSGNPDVSICGVVNIIYSKIADGSESAVSAKLEIFNSTSVDVVPMKIMSDLDYKITRIEYCLGDYPLMTIYNSYDVPLIPSIIYL
jgi:sialate O-acetylesterase